MIAMMLNKDQLIGVGMIMLAIGMFFTFRYANMRTWEQVRKPFNAYMALVFMGSATVALIMAAVR